MSETVLILRAQKYEFTNEKTGELIKGCNVIYITDYQTETASAVGDASMKVSVTDEVFNSIKTNGAPGIYQIDTRSRPGKDGTATLTITNANFVQAFTLAQYR
jgi:hypothetical protein